MPLSDWRDGPDHADAAWGSLYSLDYLKANIEGGEYFDWYYDSPEGEASQRREPITDGDHDEPWVYRTKDLRNWWQNLHHNRTGGTRSALPTAWVPMSKPFRFTEYGCAAIDKGTNQPNRFLDIRSSESGLPRASNGQRDDLIQLQYLTAMCTYWAEPEKNPVSPLYSGPMLDMARAHVWAWDARPFPAFPSRADLWGDAPAYSRGHWLNGRATNQPLSAVVAEICRDGGVADPEVSELHGIVRGYAVDEVQSGRASLQPLLLAYAMDASDRDGKLRFTNRAGRPVASLSADLLAQVDETDGYVEISRTAEPEIGAVVRLAYIDVQGDFDVRTSEVRFPDEDQRTVSASELALGLTASEARATVHRWLAETRIGRESARFALPPSRRDLGAGDTVALGDGLWRIDRVEIGEAALVEATRVEPGAYVPAVFDEEVFAARSFAPPVPTYPVFLDLPLLTGSEVPHAPHIAVTAEPWPGTVAVWASAAEDGFELNRIVAAPAIIGVTETALPRARPGVWDRGEALRVRVVGGDLSSAALLNVLNGANVMAIGDGSAATWEVLQFAEAQLVAPDTFEVSLAPARPAWHRWHHARGMAVGSTVVMIDRALQQIDVAPRHAALSATTVSVSPRAGSTTPRWSRGRKPLMVSACAPIPCATCASPAPRART